MAIWTAVAERVGRVATPLWLGAERPPSGTAVAGKPKRRRVRLAAALHKARPSSALRRKAPRYEFLSGLYRISTGAKSWRLDISIRGLSSTGKTSKAPPRQPLCE